MRRSLPPVVILAALWFVSTPALALDFNAEPSAAIQLDEQWGCGDLWGDEERIAVALRGGGVALLETGEPANLVELGRWDPGNVYIEKVKLRGDLIAASNMTFDGAALYLLDAADPGAIVERARLELEPGLEACGHVWLDPRGYLYCAITSFATGNEVRIYALPRLEQIGSFAYQGSGNGAEIAIRHMMVQGDLLYMAWLEGGLVLADISDPSQPEQIGTNVHYQDNYTNHVWPTADASHVLTADERSGGLVRIWDIRDPQRIQQVATYSAHPRAVAQQVMVKGDLAYLSYYEEGLRILDISAPEHPVEVAYRDELEGPPEGSFVGTCGVWPYQSADNPPGVREYIYTSQREGKVEMVALNGPRKARVWGRLTHVGDGSPLALATLSVRESGHEARSDGAGDYSLWTGAAELNIDVRGFGVEDLALGLSLAPGEERWEDLSLTRDRRVGVVVVDDDGGEQREARLLSWLDEVSPPYQVWDVAANGPVQPSRFEHFLETPLILWMTGAVEQGTLTSAEQESLSVLMDRQHNVFLTGQFIGDELGAGHPWLRERFAADHLSDAIAMPFLQGLPGDPVTNGMFLRMNTENEGWGQSSPGRVVPVEAGEPLLAYAGTEWYAGVRRTAPGKRTIFLEFGLSGLEAGNGLTPPSEFLRSALYWFGVLVNLEGEGVGPSSPRPALGQNAPNPFNPRTDILLDLTAADCRAPVSLRIYDAGGRLIRTLFQGQLEPGRHLFTWDGRHAAGSPAPSARYIYRLKTATRSEQRSMLLLK